MANNTPISTTSIHLVTRFTTSIPDITLTLPLQTTTVLRYRHLLRQSLPPSASSHRLRLIYSGKILSDSATLSSIIKPVPPPPKRDVKGKGKAVLAPETQRVYINCSIGDELSEEELQAEEAAARLDEERNAGDGETVARKSDGDAPTRPTTTTLPAPRGFDRLLDTGFTAAEVGQLRLQFRTIRAAGYTPDTMPSPDALRRMEDEWIDNNGAMGAGDGGSEAEAEAAAGAVDDLIVGLVIGFMWPIGVMCWAIREEGIWSPRRQVAVWSGFMTAVVFGCMSYLG